MKTKSVFALTTMIVVLSLASTQLRADTGTCGGATTILPFNDVAGSQFFCQIAEAFFSGLTNGTTPTTYSPNSTVARQEMAAFITRTLDQALKRGSRRAALDQFWMPNSLTDLTPTAVGVDPQLVQTDGADLWVANSGANSVSRIRASDGRLLETWTGATQAFGVLIAKGKVYITGQSSPGALYVIDPSLPAGAVTTLANNLGDSPAGIAFDGSRIWTANQSGSVSIITLNPVTVTTVTAGFSSPQGILFDGASMWVTDAGDNKMKRLDSNGNVLQNVNVGISPRFPTFDGSLIWVPNSGSNSMTLVRAVTGNVVLTIGGNGLSFPYVAAFDGERVMVSNQSGGFVVLWKAADTSLAGLVTTGSGTLPVGVCSDGLNFWITLQGPDTLIRF